MEGIDGGKDVLEVLGVVGVVWVGTVEGVFWGVEIEDEVDAGVGEEFHADIVWLGVVDRVDADGVDSELLEVLNVACAVGLCGNWIFEFG